MWFDKNFLLFVPIFLLLIVSRLWDAKSFGDVVFFIFAAAFGILLLFAYEWIGLSLLAWHTSRKLKGDKIMYAKKVFFVLHTPDGKVYQNPIYTPQEQLGQDVSKTFQTFSFRGVAAVFLTKNKQFLLVYKSRKEDPGGNGYKELVNIPFEDLKEVHIEDYEVPTGGLPAPGVKLTLVMSDSKRYILEVGGVGLSKLFPREKIRQNFKKPLLKFFQSKIV